MEYWYDDYHDTIYDLDNDGDLDLIDYRADETGEGFGIWLNDENTFKPHFSTFFEAPSLSSNEYYVLMQI